MTLVLKKCDWGVHVGEWSGKDRVERQQLRAAGVWTGETGVLWEEEKLKVSVRLINLMADAK